MNSCIDEVWKEHGAELGEAYRSTTERGRAMEEAIIEGPETKRAEILWAASEEAQQLFDRVQTRVRRAFERLGTPVNYVGAYGVTLKDGTRLCYP